MRGKSGEKDSRILETENDFLLVFFFSFRFLMIVTANKIFQGTGHYF